MTFFHTFSGWRVAADSALGMEAMGFRAAQGWDEIGDAKDTVLKKWQR